MEPEQPEQAASKRGGREMTLEVLLQATKLTVGKHENLAHYLKRMTHLTLNGDGAGSTKKTPPIRKIQNLHHCPNLKVLYLYDNEIDVIENLEPVPQLSHLHLQHNRIARMEGLGTLQHLEKLYLDGNRISRLEGLGGCFFLQELHLSNQTVSPDAEFMFEEDTMRTLSRSLRVLNLANCRVRSARFLSVLRNLEQLDLSKNLLTELDDVFELLAGLSGLVELDLSLNPVTSAPKYREKAITFSSSRLMLLDKKDVDANQRRMMQSHLAHKFRKRQEASGASTGVNTSAASTTVAEAKRSIKHGVTTHQLRNAHVGPRNPSTSSGFDGFGIAGAACNPSSSLLVRSNNNNNASHRGS